MEGTKVKKSYLNTSIGLLVQVFQMILSFTTRTIFINLLGAEYLGINGIFTNVLSMLSIAELGIGNILIFYLYNPLSKGDNMKISEIINFSRKSYLIIASVITIIGLLMIPLLPLIVNSDLPVDSLVKYYIIFLANSIASYLYIYKSNLLIADQKIYKTSISNAVVVLIQYLIQIIVLVYTRNYTLYLIVLVGATLLNNVIKSKIADKTYPYLKENIKRQLPLEEKSKIYSDLKSIFFYKIGTVIMNYTDNILISIIVGTVSVGYYSNYLLLISFVSSFISIIISGVSASIGTLITEKNNKKNKFF